MMRVLYVLRHAKAEETAAAGDRARALKRRGRAAARAAGRFLAALGEPPELVLASPAVRARETAELAREECAPAAPLELREEVYEATPEGLLEVVRSLPDGRTRVLFVGHQPGLALLVALLTGHGPELAPGAMARLDLGAGPWAETAPRGASLAWLVSPGILELLPPGH
jgi:phosphohistidine phosphatase